MIKMFGIAPDCRPHSVSSSVAFGCLKLFATVPDSSINSWESGFIFNLRKNKHRSVLRIRFPERRKLRHIMRIHDITRWRAYNNYCTYWNSHLLEAPREYVLQGLYPGLNWAPFWPLPMSMHLVATPNPVSCCLLQRVRFHLPFFLAGWLTPTHPVGYRNYRFCYVNLL